MQADMCTKTRIGIRIDKVSMDMQKESGKEKK